MEQILLTLLFLGVLFFFFIRQFQGANAGAEAELDTERFRRCLINVIDNACQAMQEAPEGTGRLTVETGVRDGRLEISVSDTGPGIAPGDVEAVFEPLYSTKGFGVGLGLPIVRHIVEQHGGGIDIASTPGEGTCVTLWLPVKTRGA